MTFELGRIFESAVDRIWNIMHSHVVNTFPWRLRNNTTIRNNVIIGQQLKKNDISIQIAEIDRNQ